MKHTIYTLFFFLFLLGGVTQAQQIKKVKAISPKKFEKKMDNPSVVILDVRTEQEYKDGHLDGALLMDVQKDDFIQQLAKLDKNKTYLVYCKSGRRSAKALEVLGAQGFPRGYHLEGGFLNWKIYKEK